MLEITKVIRRVAPCWIGTPVGRDSESQPYERSRIMAYGRSLSTALAPNNCVAWTGGRTGATYETYNDPIGSIYIARPGVYIFCKTFYSGLLSGWYAIYVGETDDFQRRLTNELSSHHRWDCIRTAGATHICSLHVPHGQAERLRIETDLRHGLNPPCNRQ
jgi:hypothetical protein